MAQYQPMYDSFHRTRERYVPTARLGVSVNVQLPGGDIDLETGRLKPDHQRRRRTQSLQLENTHLGHEKHRVAKKLNVDNREKGKIKVSTLLGITIVFSFLLLGVTLIQQGVINMWQERINDQETVIDNYKASILLLEEELAAASDPSIICYAASQELNMVPAESIKAIELTAADTRPLETAKRQRQMANAAAQAEQIQTTPVPMTASN